MNERLDETIDRIAAELTAVPPDPGFSARVRHRLPPTHPRRSTWLVASAAAAAAAAIALTVIARFAAMPSGDAVEEMEVPAVAVIVPLDVPHLEIGDIADGEVAKEPK
jgi:hypothetical protein